MRWRIGSGSVATSCLVRSDTGGVPYSFGGRDWGCAVPFATLVSFEKDFDFFFLNHFIILNFDFASLTGFRVGGGRDE